MPRQLLLLFPKHFRQVVLALIFLLYFEVHASLNHNGLDQAKKWWEYVAVCPKDLKTVFNA